MSILENLIVLKENIDKVNNNELINKEKIKNKTKREIKNLK